MSYRNDLVLSKDVVESWRQENYAEIAPSEAFEIFMAEQILKDYELSPKEIEEGITDGTNDGGLDAVYTFIDSELVDADHRVFDTNGHRAYVEPTVHLYLLQTKYSEGFPQDAVDAVYTSTAALLDLSRELEDLRNIYNSEVCDRIALFRRVIRALAVRRAKIEIHFVYSTLGDVSAVNATTKDKARQLAESFEHIRARGTSLFIGATEIWDLYNVHPKTEFSLRVVDSCSSDNGISAIVTLREYFNFLTTDPGGDSSNRRLVSGIFDWNVRDYQGGVAVNKEIHDSILSEAGPPFWWKNNGVTVVATRVNELDKTIHTTDPQIVNGLQTSTTIYETLKDVPVDHAAFDKKVQVRFLQTDDEVARDQVIRATNRQTNVSDASLYATDPIQRDIEHYLIKYDWYYDRRKNYYKNQGKKPSRILGIQALAQLLLAAGLGQPDTARARPGTALKKQDTYDRIFRSDTPLWIYRWLCDLNEQVRLGLLSQVDERSLRNNLHYYVLAVFVWRRAGRRVETLRHLASIAVENDKFPTEEINLSIMTTLSTFEDQLRKSEMSADALAKGREFSGHLLAELSETR